MYVSSASLMLMYYIAEPMTSVGMTSTGSTRLQSRHSDRNVSLGTEGGRIHMSPISRGYSDC